MKVLVYVLLVLIAFACVAMGQKYAGSEEELGTDTLEAEPEAVGIAMQSVDATVSEDEASTTDADSLVDNTEELSDEQVLAHDLHY